MLITWANVNSYRDKSFEINRPHGSGDYPLMLVKTHAFFEFNGKATVVPPNFIIIFDKQSPQHYWTYGDTFCSDVIHFDLDSESKELLLANIKLDTVIPVSNPNEFSTIIQLITSEYISNNKFKNISIEFLLRLILTKIIEQSCSTNTYPYYDQLIAIRSDIYSNPTANWTIHNMSQSINLSPSYFQAIYKKTFNISFMTDVINSRINHAKQLLLGTDYTISKIASSLGYNSDVHFMRQFKKLIGVTPSEYRKNIKV